jgi:hypothetical protein
MKHLLAPLVLISMALLCRPAVAQKSKPEPEQEPDDESFATAEVYLTFMPFLEYVGVTGPTVRGFQAEPGHVGTATADYTGVAGPPRVRMTSGTSHIGFRGSLKLHEQFIVLGQFETAMVIDGDANPWESEFPNRDSYLGFKGDWGTLAFGRLDTPYKWVTLTTINPIKGGYVADYTAIIGTPGFLAQSLNAVPRYTFSPFSNVAFLRREANSIQYWSPTLAGFSLRAGVVANEFRPAAEEADDGTVLSPESDPYIISAAVGFDWGGLTLRYASELHHDYFGVAYVSQQTDVPATTYPTSTDWGNTAVLGYALTINPDLKTRVVAVGEYLRYSVSHVRPAPGEFDNVSGVVNDYSRPAFYVLLEQTIAEHRVWGAYGRAFAGECSRIAMADGLPSLCTTQGVGADWIQAGYVYEFTENAQGYFAAYRLRNERSGLYVTTPSLLREGLSPGYDQLAAGLGFRYAFGADLLQ